MRCRFLRVLNQSVHPYCRFDWGVTRRLGHLLALDYGVFGMRPVDPLLCTCFLYSERYTRLAIGVDGKVLDVY